MSAEGKLYFLVTVDVDPAVEERFNEWYNARHMPDVLACPGFVRGWRLRALDDAASPRYAGVYEVEHEHVLETPELAAIRGFGEFAEHTSNHQRFWFRAIHEDGPGG